MVAWITVANSTETPVAELVYYPMLMGDWRSGSAGALHAQGQRFKSVIAHHKTPGQRLAASDLFGFVR